MSTTAIRVHIDKPIEKLTGAEYLALLDDMTAQIKSRLIDEAEDKAIVYIEQQAEDRVKRSIYACRYDRVNEKMYFFNGQGDA